MFRSDEEESEEEEDEEFAAPPKKQGAAKAPALREIAHGVFQPALHPGQTLRAFASRVTWLADQEAAAGL